MGFLSKKKEACFALAAVVLTVVILWGVPELIVRLAGPTLQQFKAIHFGRDENSPVLFMKDPVLHWRLRPDTEVEFLGFPVVTDGNGFRGKYHQQGEKTVLCLGGSTTFGWKVGDESTFAFHLEDILNRIEDLPSSWKVYNAGVPGYSSFQARMVAEELLPRLKPDYLIVCVGNNDAWPSRRSDRQIHEDRRYTALLERTVSRSRFLVWLKERVRPETPKPFITREYAGAGPRVSGEEYGANMAEIVYMARRHGSTVILVSPPVNLFHQLLMTEVIPNWEFTDSVWMRARDLEDRVEIEKELVLVDNAIRENPDDFDHLWLRGMLLVKMGEYDTGRALLEDAVERHPFPFRSKPSYRRALREVARRNKVLYLNVNELFTYVSKGKPEAWLFLDHCHPTAEGHELITRALAPMILEVEKRRAGPP